MSVAMPASAPRRRPRLLALGLALALGAAWSALVVARIGGGAEPLRRAVALDNRAPRHLSSALQRPPVERLQVERRESSAGRPRSSLRVRELWNELAALLDSAYVTRAQWVSQARAHARGLASHECDWLAEQLTSSGDEACWLSAYELLAQRRELSGVAAVMTHAPVHLWHLRVLARDDVASPVRRAIALRGLARAGDRSDLAQLFERFLSDSDDDSVRTLLWALSAAPGPSLQALVLSEIQRADGRPLERAVTLENALQPPSNAALRAASRTPERAGSRPLARAEPASTRPGCRLTGRSDRRYPRCRAAGGG